MNWKNAASPLLVNEARPFLCASRFLQRYVQKETEHLQSSKATVSATTIATRLKKMAEMCSLVKYFIRCANKRKRKRETPFIIVILIKGYPYNFWTHFFLIENLTVLMNQVYLCILLLFNLYLTR